MHTKLKLLGCLLWLFSAWQLHAQTIQLTSPNGGETWVGGTTRTITWSYTNIDNIKIEYSLNNGLTWKVISESTPASALSYNWVVPCIGSLNAKVRVTSVLQFVQDESNGTFTIPEPTVDITYPNGGEAFGTGTGQYGKQRVLLHLKCNTPRIMEVPGQISVIFLLQMDIAIGLLQVQLPLKQEFVPITSKVL